MNSLIEKIEIVNLIDYNIESVDGIQAKVSDVFNRYAICPDTNLPNPVQKLIFRARPVPCFSKIEKVADLSCPPVECCRDFGRAGLPGHNMFYGTTGIELPYPNEFMGMKLGALYETMDCFRKDEVNDGVYKAVIGTWEIISEIKCFTIINPYSDHNKVPMHVKFAERLDSQICNAERLGLTTKEETYALHSFLFNQFGKQLSKVDGVLNTKEYITPATAAHLILKSSLEQNGGHDGIIYESVQCEDANLHHVTCIVLLPDSVNNKLRLIRAEDITITIKNGIPGISFKEHTGKIAGLN